MPKYAPTVLACLVLVACARTAPTPEPTPTPVSQAPVVAEMVEARAEATVEAVASQIQEHILYITEYSLAIYMAHATVLFNLSLLGNPPDPTAEWLDDFRRDVLEPTRQIADTMAYPSPEHDYFREAYNDWLEWADNPSDTDLAESALKAFNNGINEAQRVHQDWLDSNE